MNITVNGEITVCNEGATLLDLILRLGLSPEKSWWSGTGTSCPPGRLPKPPCRTATRLSCCSLSAAGKAGVFPEQANLLKKGGVSAFLCLSSLMRRLLREPDRRCSAPPGALFGAFFWGVCPVIFSECSLKDGP